MKKYLKKTIDVVTQILSYFLIFLMGLMVIDVVWQVFSRFVIQAPSSFTEELAGFLLIWIGLLGCSYAYYKKAHLGIDTVTSLIAPFYRNIVEIIIQCVICIFALFVLFIGGIKLVNLTFTLGQISPAIKIPMGYIYLVLPLTGLLFIFYSVYFLFEAIDKIIKKDDKI